MPRPKLKKWIGPIFAAVLFGLSVRLLASELSTVSWEEFRRGLTGIRPIYLVFAVVLIAMNYALLISYDLLAMRYICRSLPLRRVALVSFLGYSLGNNLGTFLAAAPIRFRFYSRWGLSHSQIAALITLLGLTFWSGLWFLGGTVLTLVPIELPPERRLPISTPSSRRDSVVRLVRVFDDVLFLAPTLAHLWRASPAAGGQFDGHADLCRRGRSFHQRDGPVFGPARWQRSSVFARASGVFMWHRDRPGFPSAGGDWASWRPSCCIFSKMRLAPKSPRHS